MDVTEPSNAWCLIATGAGGTALIQNVRILSVETDSRAIHLAESVSFEYTAKMF